MKKALITGVTGQDGSYLVELLLKKGYEVYGIKRRSSSFNTQRIDHIYKDKHLDDNKLHLIFGDVCDSLNISRIISEVQPDEIYNLAAQSHVAVSFETPEYTANADALGTLRILEAIKNSSKKIKFYQASTSELYGGIGTKPLNEESPFAPRSPYAVAKLYSYWLTVNYREAYDMFACNGILFNHESPRRGETFVTRKITRGLARIFYGLDKTLYMGNLDALRDWGHAKDYVYAMWLMLQQEKPEDFCISTGIKTNIRDFIKLSASKMGFDIEFKGQGLDEVGYVSNIITNDSKLVEGQEIIEIDKAYFRPLEVNELLGDSSKAKEKLNWSPKISLEQMCEEMVAEDLKLQKLNIK
jgi:GDPmannose 4,6-dehydratase